MDVSTRKEDCSTSARLPAMMNADGAFTEDETQAIQRFAEIAGGIGGVTVRGEDLGYPEGWYSLSGPFPTRAEAKRYRHAAMIGLKDLSAEEYSDAYPEPDLPQPKDLKAESAAQD